MNFDAHRLFRFITGMLITFAAYSAVYALLSTFLWAWLAAVLAFAITVAADVVYNYSGKGCDVIEAGGIKALTGLRALRARMGV